MKQYQSDHPEEREKIKIFKLIRGRKKQIFDKKMYDDLIGWKRKTLETIKDSMNSNLRNLLKKIIENNPLKYQKDVEVIKECMKCGEGNKKAIMKLILATERMGINISWHYPNEYKEYLEIKKEIIKKRRKQKVQQAKEEKEEQVR
ncbi:MAG: hypothetical protein HFJ37_01705 [Clostridia bacterium]|nr:hypothetical protein [Clostridia bacterium]